MKNLHQWWNSQFPVLCDIERRGLHFDQERCNEAVAKCDKVIAEHESALSEWTKYYDEQQGEPINWNSVPQRQAFFYDYLGLPVEKFCGSEKAVRLNRDDKRTTDEYTIVQWARQSDAHRPYLERYLKRAQAVKTKQFLRSLPDHRSRATGRIHTSLSPSTESGRLASRNPNLQNIPASRDDFGIRRCFTAPRGRSLVVLDYSQLELYVLAHFLVEWFGDRTLADDLAEGDVHTATAVRCWNDPARRSDAKAINYSVNYGKTAVGLGAQIRDAEGEPIGTERAQELLDTYFAAYPGILEYQEKQKHDARANGYCTTLSGRKRYLDFGTAGWQERAAERKALNTPIQGSAADIVTAALIACSELPCVLQVHDELIFECNEKSAPEVFESARKGMENAGETFDLRVPLHVSGGIYPDWSAAK